MHKALEYIYQEGLREYWEDFQSIELADGVTALRDQQYEAIDWALNQNVPYLFINAPTGAGKTLLLATYGAIAGSSWTYGVHTVMLQNQVASTFKNLPVFTGRSRHPCWVGEDTLGKVDATAAEAVCTDGVWCQHTGKPSPNGDPAGELCPYFEQRERAMDSHARTANYALILSYPPLLQYNKARAAWPTDTLLADEAHNVEEAVVGAVGFKLNTRTSRRFGIQLPNYSSIMDWVAWANRTPYPEKRPGKPDLGYKTLLNVLGTLRLIKPSEAGRWLVTRDEYGVEFVPIWGAPYVLDKLLGHKERPKAMGNQHIGGVSRALFSSATLMGAEYTAEMLGLPDGTWAYLDLSSTFPVENRPINYAPVDNMNASKTGSFEGRAKMQAAIDRLIEFYMMRGQGAGLIHAVSNKYRDAILTESRWGVIMTSDPEIHKSKIEAGEASVLVAANLIEGWDGADDLCRFVLMPKVPFPYLGDQRTKIRKEEDPRSFDHKALVAVVQGAGRGVRHKDDKADTWILDGSWRQLFLRRRTWLPSSFLSAYNHNVSLP